MHITELADPNLGIITRKAALSLGVPRSSFETAVSTGELIKLTRTHYALRDTRPEVVAAVQSRGVISCESAFAHHGGWVMSRGPLHVRRNKDNRHRYPLSKGAIDCWPRPGAATTEPVGIVDDLPTALSTLLSNHGDEAVVLALDSVLHKRLMSRFELDQLVARHSMRELRLLNRADGAVESPLESLLRYRLQQHRISVRIQVRVPGLGRVDMLVGRCLLLELDGFEFHSSTEAFANDRRRDREAVKRGYYPMRITWSDLMHRWDQVLEDILSVLRRRRHLRVPDQP